MKRLFFLISFLITNVSFAAGGFTWIGTLHLPIAWNVATFAFVGLVLVTMALVYRKKIAAVSNVVIPDKGFTLRNVIEAFGQFIYTQCKTVIGEK